MGKRELLLISGFAVIGLLVYQLTMPATADTGGGFAAWWARVRSHVGQNRVEQHYERKEEVTVPADIRTVAVQLDRASVTILGEPRDTIAVDLSGVVFGGDDEMAKTQAQQIAVAVTTDGSIMKLATDPAEAGRAWPAGRASSSRCACRRGSASSCAWAAASSTSPTSARCRSSRRRAASGSPRSPAPSPASWARARSRSTTPGRWPSRPATARSASPTSPARFEVEARRGDFRARGIGGAAHLEGRDVEAELEDLAGPLRLTGSGGEVRVRDVRGPITAETERTTLKLTPGTAVEISATTEHDAIELTLPSAGIVLDAKATDGDIRTPDGLITVQRSGEDATASGPLRGGGPRVMLRTSRGDITVR